MHFLTEYVIEFTSNLRTYYTDIFCRKTLSWLVEKAEMSFKSTNFITSQSFSIFNEKMYTVSGCLLLHDNGCVVKYHVNKPGRKPERQKRTHEMFHALDDCTNLQ